MVKVGFVVSLMDRKMEAKRWRGRLLSKLHSERFWGEKKTTNGIKIVLESWESVMTDTDKLKEEKVKNTSEKERD